MRDIELILLDRQISLLLRATLSTRHSGATRKRRTRNPLCRRGKWFNGFRVRAHARPGMTAEAYAVPLFRSSASSCHGRSDQAPDAAPEGEASTKTAG